MNATQRKALSDVYDALACPFPASGSQSTSIAGLSGYVSDMRKIVPIARRILLHVAVGESESGELQDDLDDLAIVMESLKEAKS